MKKLGMVLCWIAVVGQVAAAQDSASVRPLCFSAKRADRCRSYLVTELAILGAVASTGVPLQQTDDFGTAITGTAGLMSNWSKNDAVGITFQLSSDDPDQLGPAAMEVRWRRWLKSGPGAVDFSAGYGQAKVYSRKDPSAANLTARGLTAAVIVRPVEWLGVTARGMELRDAEGGRRAGLRAGIQFGSAAAPIVAAAIVIGFVGLFALAGGGT
jgi:hypothetical protein